MKNFRVQNDEKYILVTGSLAYDHLMRYDGVFQEQILPGKIDVLSVSFLVSPRETFFGGCGGNIAFHLKKTGGDPLLIGLVGNDFEKYNDWFSMHKINTEFLIRDSMLPTPAAFIATDQKDHQIALFDAGCAENFTKEKKAKVYHAISENRNDIIFAIISPTNKDLMLFAMGECIKAKIPCFFDPGQVIHEFTETEARNTVTGSAGIFVNEYEMQLLLKQTGWSHEILQENCPLIIETLGAKGSMIIFHGQTIHIDSVPAPSIEDPTGCGDAYRAAFLKELGRSFPKFSEADIKRAGNFASQLSSKVVMKKGTQVEV